MNLGNLAERFKEWVAATAGGQDNPQEQGDLTKGGNPDWWKLPTKAPVKWVDGPYYHNRESNRARVFGSRTQRRDEDLHRAYVAFLRQAKKRDLDKLPAVAPRLWFQGNHTMASAPTWVERQHE